MQGKKIKEKQVEEWMGTKRSRERLCPTNKPKLHEWLLGRREKRINRSCFAALSKSCKCLES